MKRLAGFLLVGFLVMGCATVNTATPVDPQDGVKPVVSPIIQGLCALAIGLGDLNAFGYCYGVFPRK